MSLLQGTYDRLEVAMDKKVKINHTQEVLFEPMQEKPNKPNTVQCVEVKTATDPTISSLKKTQRCVRHSLIE
ncbi:MAG: hypothetical protein ACK4LA_03005 [Aquificaceae bacterium]